MWLRQVKYRDPLHGGTEYTSPKIAHMRRQDGIVLGLLHDPLQNLA